MLRKIAEIKVPTGAGAREAKTEPVFASYDRQGAAFAFYFSDSNIARATANLLFMVDGQKVFVDDGVTLSETNETHTFTYPLPDKLLNYTGKVDGYLYFDFEDGSHSDEIHFVFTIKKSKIDEEMEEAPDIYIKSFEDVKEQVEQAADGAKETISKKVTEVSDTSNSAISKVNQAADGAKETISKKVTEVSDTSNSAISKVNQAADGAKETISKKVTEVSDTSNSAISKVNQVADDTIKTADQAQGDIQTSVSDVQSSQAGAEKDISGLVESTESARDEAVKTMNELDYSDRNLFVSSKAISSKTYSSEPKVEDNGRKISVEYKENQKGAVALGSDGWKPTEGKYTLSGRIEINGEPITQETFSNKRIYMGHPFAYNERFEVLSDGTIIATERFGESNNRFFLQAQFEGLSDGDAITFYDLQFQPGSVPTPWQPAMGDYDAKIKKLENAITSLGGSV